MLVGRSDRGFCEGPLSVAVNDTFSCVFVHNFLSIRSAFLKINFLKKLLIA